MHRIAALVLGAIVLAGCALAPVPTRRPVSTAAPDPSTAAVEPTIAPPTVATSPTPAELRAHGDPLEPPPVPDAAACDSLLRADEAAAAAIRTDLRIPAIATDPATVASVARDPAASTATLGIPLTAAETAALRTDRGPNPQATEAIEAWVNVGAADRFGGIWIDPPGSHSYVVAIVDGDSATLSIARCLEKADTRYVWASLSIREGRARAQRIAADMQALRAQGVEVNSVGYQENEGTVVVGVTHPTSELQTLFLARYGPPLRLEEEGPIVEY